MNTTDTGAGNRTSANRTFGYLFGATYLLVGILGFFVTDGVEFASSEGNELIAFEVNPLHNIVHLAIAGLLIAGAAAGVRAARAMNMTVGLGYLAVGIAGLFLADGNQEMNILAINQADNALHIGTALLALGIALFTDRGERDTVSTTGTANTTTSGTTTRSRQRT